MRMTAWPTRDGLFKLRCGGRASTVQYYQRADGRVCSWSGAEEEVTMGGTGHCALIKSAPLDFECATGDQACHGSIGYWSANEYC